MKRFILILLGSLFAVYGIKSQTQIATETVCLCMDSVAVGYNIVQVPVEECDKMEKTRHQQYAIVYKDGKCSIYDLKNEANITEIQFTKLRIRDRIETVHGPIVLWAYWLGEQRGLLDVFENGNMFISVRI